MKQNHTDFTSASGDPLGDRLKEEARRTRPPFSPVLHQRIMRAAGRSREQHVGPITFIGRWWFTGAAAAVLAVSASLILLIVAGQTRHTPQPASQVAAAASIEILADLFDRGVTGTPAFVVNPIANQHWAHLDEDVISLIGSLLDQLPLDMIRLEEH